MHPEGGRRREGLALAVIGLGTCAPAADSAVNAALPAIAGAFDVHPGAIRWVVIDYVLVYACLMIVMGHFGDRRGHWRVFRWGLWSGLLAYALCSLAPSYAWLLAGRILQGLSTALLLGVGPALAVEVCGESRRTRALALYAAIAAGAAALAPLLAGWAISVAGWSIVFTLRLPLVALALLLLAWRGAPDRQGHALARPASGHLSSAGTSACDPDAGMPGRAHAAPPRAAPSRAAPPRAAPSLVNALKAHALPPLSGLHLVHAWAQACGFTSMLLTPFLLADVMQIGPTPLGAVLSLWPAGLALGNLLAPRLVTATGERAATAVGLWVLVLGSLALAYAALSPSLVPGPAHAGRSPYLLAAGLLVQGIGLGLVQLSYTARVMQITGHGQEGVAGAATLSSRTLGILLAAFLWPWFVEEAVRSGMRWSEGLGALYALGALSLGVAALVQRAPPNTGNARTSP